jgi:RHS repeat-associated protein
VNTGRLGQYTDRTGNVRYTPGSGWKHYYPYGEEVTSTSGDAYKFAQLYRDQDTGLDYAMNRYYGSGIGRFLTTDPVGERSSEPCTRGKYLLKELHPNRFVSQDPQSLNRYAYVGGDPINYSDPYGLLRDGNPGEPDCSGGDPPVVVETPKSTPCEINASIIDGYIASTPIYGNPKLSKPLEGMGQAFIDAALKYNTNPAVLVAIGFRESHWGYDTQAGGSNNAFGLLNSNGSLIRYASWENGISGASKTVDSAYNRGNRSVADLYSGLPGAYCTHGPCPSAIPSLEKMVRALGEDPDYLGFDCVMKDGVLVKKQ